MKTIKRYQKMKKGKRNKWMDGSIASCKEPGISALSRSVFLATLLKADEN